MKKNKFGISPRVMSLLKNKYSLTGFGFLVWLCFFDRNDILTTSSYRKNLNALKEEKAYYEEGIRKNNEDLKNLLTNQRNLEKYGRENFLMKKDNEEIFVIVEQAKEEK